MLCIILLFNVLLPTRYICWTCYRLLIWSRPEYFCILTITIIFSSSSIASPQNGFFKMVYAWTFSRLIYLETLLTYSSLFHGINISGFNNFTCSLDKSTDLQYCWTILKLTSHFIINCSWTFLSLVPTINLPFSMHSS